MNKLVIVVSIVIMGVVSAGSAIAAGGSVALDHADNNVANTDSLQRGMSNFMNYCSGCHSAKYVRYNTLGEALGLSDEQLINNLMFNADKTHETINVAMRESDAQAWFAQVPPDLSLIARSKGADHIYTFLRSYYADSSSRTGWNNTLVAGVSMPHVLWELEGVKVPGHADDAHDGEDDGHGSDKPAYDVVSAGALASEDYDQFVRDTVNFLAFISEPVQLQRQKIGVWVMAFLIIFGLLAYMLKKEIWKEVK
ncbi:MAG: cytochrome c1 [Pseudomonadota bacterium]